MVYNGEEEGTVKTAKGWNEFQDFIIQGGRFSKDLPGDAIFILRVIYLITLPSTPNLKSI